MTIAMYRNNNVPAEILSIVTTHCEPIAKAIRQNTIVKQSKLPNGSIVRCFIDCKTFCFKLVAFTSRSQLELELFIKLN